MSPKVKYINGIYMHEDAFNPPDVSASENVEYSIIDLADEGEIKIKLKKIKHAKSGEYSIIDLTEEGPIKIRVKNSTIIPKKQKLVNPLKF